MRKFVLLAFISASMLFMSSIGYAQKDVGDDFNTPKANTGYVITKDIQLMPIKADEELSKDYTIKAGRICTAIKGDSNTYNFSMLYDAEPITIGKDHIYISYGDEPSWYAKREAFDKSAQKVSIYISAPRSWKTDTVYTLVPMANNLRKWVSVRPVVIKDKDAVFVDITYNYDDNIERKERISMYNKLVYEITVCTSLDTIRSYSYNGWPFMANFETTEQNPEDLNEIITIDEKGYIYARKDEENSSFHPCHELGSPCDPNIGFVGWTSPTQMIIEDYVYDLDDGSCQKAPANPIPSFHRGKE